jgi:eukaryotic-like serine/threonine-protein kinase
MVTADHEQFKGDERFSIIRYLGGGAFGLVYQVRDLKLNSVVALKVLRNVAPDALYRFKREFRALMDIRHPNLITLYELKHRPTWLFTMEFVEGCDFLQYVRNGNARAPIDRNAITRRDIEPENPTLGDVSVPQAHEFSVDFQRLRTSLTQLSEGLCALHEAGKLHRDIKPSNIMITREGRVVILDFGLLTELSQHSIDQSLTVAGTPAYMSPEQAGGLPATESSDWYCVGVMLYEALTGQLPFEGKNYLEVLRRKQQTDPVAPSELAPNIPNDLSELCQELLRRDPKTRPTGSEILQRLRSHQTAGQTFTSGASKISSTFVGRGAQLEVLEQAFSDLQNGSAVTLCVQGRSGMGKTALVNNFLESRRSTDRDAVILSGRCYEQESVPYKALDSLIDALSRYLKRLPPLEVAALIPRDVLALARLFPVLRQVNAIAVAQGRVLEIPDSQELRRRAFGALRDLLARLADRRPLVLFIDDLQWGDLDSVALISELMRPPDPPTMLLIVSYRAEDVNTSSPLQALSQLRSTLGAAVDIRELTVDELLPTEARELAFRLLGESLLGEEHAEAIAREAGASPFFIHELSRYSILRQGQESANATPDVYNYTKYGGASLDEVIWDRVSRLPETALSLLELIAVAGRPIPLDLTNEAVKAGGVDNQALAILRSEHLIRIRESQNRVEIETFHDRVRETVVAHLTAAELQEYHQVLAYALESQETLDLDALVVHFQGAGIIDKAASYAVAAANQAVEALAFNRAVRLYRLALELTTDGEPGRRILRKQLADALVNDGRGSEAADVYLKLAESAQGLEKLEMQQRAGEQFLRSGRIDEGLAVLRTLLSVVGVNLPETPRRALPSLLIRRVQVWARGFRFKERKIESIPAEELIKIDICWTAAAGLSTVDTLRGANFQALHFLMALNAGERYRVTRAIATEAGYSATRGGRSRKRTRKLVDMATLYAETINHPHAMGIAALAGGLADFFSGRWKGARVRLGNAEAILSERCKGVAWELNMSRFYTLISLIYMGEMAEAARRLPAILNDAKERGDVWATTNLQILVSYLMFLVADDIESARREAAEAIDRWSHQGIHNQHWHNLLAQGEIALYAQDGPAAWKLITERYPSLQRSLTLRPQVSLISAMRLRARCALAAASKEQTTTVRNQLLQSAEKDAQRIEREKMAWGNALAQIIYAGVAAARGQAQKAITLLAKAAIECETNDMLLFAAVARRRRGELLGDDEGLNLVAEANAWMIKRKVQSPDRIAAMLAPGEWVNGDAVVK